MKTNNSLLFFAALLALAITSCQKEPLETDSQKKSLKSVANFSDGTYELIQPYDYDPLWKFTKSGDNMQFETDPSVTSWGNDYWGYWADPLILEDDSVNFIPGAIATYFFDVQDEGLVDVTRRLTVVPYLGGSPIITNTHPGIYQLTGSSGGGDDNGGDPQPEWIVISSENAESSPFDWQSLGGDAGLYTGGAYAHEGTNAAFIRDNNGLQSSIQQYSFDATSYTELEFNFWFYAVSMENGEDFRILFDNGGGNWVVVASYSNGTDFLNNMFYNKVLKLSSEEYNFTSGARFRITCNASNNSDVIFIDEMIVKGLN